MRISRVLCLLFFVAAISLSADTKDPGAYPLRIHIFTQTQTNFYHNRSLEETKGEGRANLFENGEPRGVDFSFDCSEKVKPSFGFETYPAKWKKINQELTVLFPVFGKQSSYFTCNLKTKMRDDVYFLRNGRLESETSAQYKAWMLKHDYDPEHGKNVPNRDAKPEAPGTYQQ